MRVLMVTPRFRPDVGGVERHVQEIGRRLAARGCSVRVLTTGAERSLPIREHVDGMVVTRVRAYPPGRDLYFSPQLYAAVREADDDIVHVQSYHTLVAPAAMFAARRAGLPYVVTFHGGGHSSSFRNRIRPVQLAALRPLLAGADRLVAVARFEIEEYGRRLSVAPERFALVPNGADLPRTGVANGKGEAGTLIVSVGRLERYKGHQRVLAALPYILESCPDARLWIAGSGPYEGDLRTLSARLGVEDRVRIEPVPREAMSRLLTSAAVVVLLSEFETHPLAAIEAAALGRPVLVARTSGLRELADDGFADAVPLGSDPPTVARAILAAVEQPHTRRQLSLPTWDDCAARLLDLYGEVLTRRACAS